MAMRPLPPLTETLLEGIVHALRRVDRQVAAVIVFGSAVYAPDLACDIDLLVISREPREWERYYDAAWQAAGGWEVDVVMVRVGEKVKGLAGAVRAFGRVLWGDAFWLKEVTDGMPVSTFEDARRAIQEGERDAHDALTTQDMAHAEERWRSAFNWLFEAARRATMAFWVTEETRWGELRRQLPQPFQDEFRAIVSTLHIRFRYEGDYPRDNPE